jgi:hypothetical protein
VTTDHIPIPHFPASGSVPPIPRSSAVERLANSLEETGVPPRAARSIAVASADPAAFRRAMQAPVRVHTANGELLVVHGRVWTLAVIPHPMNLRLSPRLRRSFSGNGLRALGRPVAGTDGTAELVVPSPDRNTVVSTLTEATMMLAQDNPMSNDIGIDGVIEPITLVPLTFEHRDGSASVTVLAAVDGSSRVAGAYQNLNVLPEQVVYSYTTDDAALRSRLGRWWRLASADRADLDENDLRLLNSVTMPAAVVIGFAAASASEAGANFARAVEARVGSIHVAPPTPWSKAAQNDAQLDAALDALGAEDALDETWVSYYAGDLTPDEAEAKGLCGQADVRSVRLLADMHRPDNVRTIHEALRGVAIRQPSYKHRAAVAAEGALRAFRNDLASTQADAARNLLAHVYAMDFFRNVDWDLDDKSTTLDGLLDDALDGDDNAGRCVLGLAIYWMARFATIRRTTRGGEVDRRDINVVLHALVENPRGLRQLHRIVADGRAGRPLRRVAKDGTSLAKSPNGKHLAVTEDWLRRTWGGEEHTGDGAHPRSPEADLLARFEKIRSDVDSIIHDVKALREPIGQDGQPIVLRLGLNPAAVDELLQQWSADIAGPLTHYRYIAET